MASTIRALADRTDRPDELVAAGEMLDLRFRDGGKTLSLRAGKLLHLLIKHAGARSCDDIEHRVTLSDLRDVWHFNADEAVETIRELVGTVVELRVRTSAGKERVLVDPLIYGVDRPDKADMDEPDGAIAYRLSPTLRRVLEQSNHWAALSRKAVLAFESRYALRLYEIVSLRKGLTRKASEVFPLDELRLRLGVPATKFPRWQDWRRFVLERAIAEVNQLSGFAVAYEPIKRGRFVTAARLIWRMQDADGRMAVMRELEASRVGRKARRNGTVEKVVVKPPEPPAVALPARGKPAAVAAFPADGPIAYGRWGEIVRQHAPAPTPDVDRVANAFRGWAAKQGIPLGGASIEKSFVTFCKGFR